MILQLKEILRTNFFDTLSLGGVFAGDLRRKILRNPSLLQVNEVFERVFNVKAAKKTPPKGFSLIELMVATTLMAIMGVTMAMTLAQTADAKDEAEVISGQYHMVRQAMRRMQDEISMAYLSVNTQTAERRVESAFKGENDKINFVAYGYVRRRAEAKQSDQQEISYFIGSDQRSGESALIRRVQVNPDTELEEGGVEQTLLRGVTNITFSYWETQKGEWLDDWDTESSVRANKLPARVKIEFSIEMDDGSTESFVSQTKIWLTTPWMFKK